MIEQLSRGRSAHLRNRRAAQGTVDDEWFTPPELVAALGRFDLDPCAGPMRHARRNIRRPACGLRAKWRGRVWLNPPYSNLPEWMAKFFEHGDGIILVPARTDAAWFHVLAASSAALLFLRSRVKFHRPDGTRTNIPIGTVLAAAKKEDALALGAARQKFPGTLTIPLA